MILHQFSFWVFSRGNGKGLICHFHQAYYASSNAWRCLANCFTMASLSTLRNLELNGSVHLQKFPLRCCFNCLITLQLLDQKIDFPVWFNPPVETSDLATGFWKNWIQCGKRIVNLELRKSSEGLKTLAVETVSEAVLLEGLLNQWDESVELRLSGLSIHVHPETSVQ